MPSRVKRLKPVLMRATVLFVVYGLWAAPVWAAETVDVAWPWWGLALGLFLLTSALGVLAALAGVGGGVLFVPIVTSLFPFMHIDFVRGAGLMVAFTGALSAGPRLLREGLTDLRLSVPVALIASGGAIVGAQVGLSLPQATIQFTLGLVILATSALIAFARPRTVPPDAPPDPIAAWLRIGGRYRDAHTGQEEVWAPRAMVWALPMFAGIGFLAGMFGLGAGWANVPVLNVLMALPLRLSVASSYFILSIAEPAAALVYLARGALLPLIVVPSVLGMMVGAKLGAWLLVRTPTRLIRGIVIGVLLLAGSRALLRGLGL